MAGKGSAAPAVAATAPMGALPSLAAAPSTPSGFTQFATAVGEAPQLMAQGQEKSSETEEQQAQLDDAKLKRLAAAVQQNPALAQNPQFAAEVRAIQNRRHMGQQKGQPQQGDLGAQIQGMLPHRTFADVSQAERISGLERTPEERRAIFRDVPDTPESYLSQPTAMSIGEKEQTRKMALDMIQKAAANGFTPQQFRQQVEFLSKQLIAADVDPKELLNNADAITTLTARAKADIATKGAALNWNAARIAKAQADIDLAAKRGNLYDTSAKYLGHKNQILDSVTKAKIDEMNATSAQKMADAQLNREKTDRLIQGLSISGTNASGSASAADIRSQRLMATTLLDQASREVVTLTGIMQKADSDGDEVDPSVQTALDDAQQRKALYSGMIADLARPSVAAAGASNTANGALNGSGQSTKPVAKPGAEQMSWKYTAKLGGNELVSPDNKTYYYKGTNKIAGHRTDSGWVPAQ